ncbi:Chondroitin synthase [compost metagenome]
MLTICILYSTNYADVETTRSNLILVAPDWNIVLLDKFTAPTLNTFVETYEEPFFVTLHAGDKLTPSFIIELQEKWYECPETSAGLLYERPTAPSKATQIQLGSGIPVEPLLWRTEAVRRNGQPYFAEHDQLPFSTYVLSDAMLRLSDNWSWTRLNSTGWSPHRTQYPAWQKAHEEWELIQPILRSPLTTINTFAAPEPLFSIAICTYNNAEYIGWSIRSVLAQTFPDWELIIIDDASTDDTKQKLQHWSNDPRIRVATNSSNMGKSPSLNKALSICSSKWLLELDADDWLPIHCLSTLATYVNLTTAEDGLLYGDHHQWVERARKQLIYSGEHKAPSQINSAMLLNNASPIAPRCYRVDALRKLGGWSLKAPYESRLYEDLEIIIRLSWYYRLLYVPHGLYHRRIRASSISQSNYDKYETWRQWMLAEESQHLEAGGLSE